jgi:hypothetical protein
MRDENVRLQAERHLFIIGASKPTKDERVTEYRLLCRHAQLVSAFRRSGGDEGPRAA